MMTSKYTHQRFHFFHLLLILTLGLGLTSLGVFAQEVMIVPNGTQTQQGTVQLTVPVQVTAPAQVVTPETPIQTMKSDWVVSRAYCPIGCSPDVTSFVQENVVGSVVQFTPYRVNSSFDECDGNVSYNFHVMNTSDLAAEVSEGRPYNLQFTPQNMGIYNPSVLTGDIACSDGVNHMQVLSLTPNRLLVLYAHQSVLELR